MKFLSVFLQFKVNARTVTSERTLALEQLKFSYDTPPPKKKDG